MGDYGGAGGDRGYRRRDAGGKALACSTVGDGSRFDLWARSTPTASRGGRSSPSPTRGTINIGVLLFAIFGVKQEYPPPGDEYVIPRTVKISESRKFAVQHGPTDRAWILLTAEHPRKRGATILTWHPPLDDEGPLNDEYLRQLENEHRFTQRVLRRVRNERRPVGPGGVTRRVISSKTRQPSGDTFVVELPKHLS